MRKADNLPPSCAVVTKSWNLNLLGPSGPVQACNGTALPFTVPLDCGTAQSSKQPLVHYKNIVLNTPRSQEYISKVVIDISRVIYIPSSGGLQ